MVLKCVLRIDSPAPLSGDTPHARGTVSSLEMRHLMHTPLFAFDSPMSVKDMLRFCRVDKVEILAGSTRRSFADARAAFGSPYPVAVQIRELL